MTELTQNPYASFLADVEKPARYIGGEHFAIRKSWNDSVSDSVPNLVPVYLAKVALCFPEVYEIGMSHLGFKILYNELNQQADILAERCFAPWGDMEKEMRSHSLPLVTLENFRPLSQFDIVGFSLQFELTYPNILNMLDLGGVPLWAHERGESDPFVVAGGPCATHPEPLAPFCDFIWVGDAEGLLVQVTRFIAKARRDGWKRQQILEAIAGWPGIYVPSLYEHKIDEVSGFEVVTGAIESLKDRVPFPVKRHIIPDLKPYPFPIRSPIPHATAIFDKFSIEISRGCTEGCRFCQAGMIYRPVREREPKTVIESVMKGLQENGYQEASLTCLSTADYSAVTPLIIELLGKMKAENSSLGIASLRAYGLDERVLDKMAEVKNSSFTFAPEAGTERMRNVINKNISEEDMLSTAEKIFSRGWQKMKLYFMIGLPTETDEDVEGIMEIANKSRQVALRLKVRNPQITVSASSFVPKPHTPFQWSPMISYSEIERKQEVLWQLARKYSLNFRKHHSKASVIEGVLARGDRRLADVIYDVWQNGARFDGWNEGFSFTRWENAFAKHGINTDLYLGEISVDAKLPWSHIDIGVEKELLQREWKKALLGRSSPPCGKTATSLVHFNNVKDLVTAHEEEKKKLVCYHCGVKCDLHQMVKDRKTHLTNLGALTPEVYEHSKAVATETIDPLSLRSKRGQNVGFKYRLHFAKVGPLSFISHLDLQKVLARVLKRSELKVLYSEGHNPRPLIGFGPALPLGINSLSEFVDIRSPELWDDTNAVLELLRKHSERGLIFFALDPIPHSSDSLQESIVAYDYFYPLQDPYEVKSVESALVKLQEQTTLLVTSSSLNKKDQERDIRPYLMQMGVEGLGVKSEETVSLLHEVTTCAGQKGVRVTVRVTKGQTIKPREIAVCLKSFDLLTHSPIKLLTHFK